MPQRSRRPLVDSGSNPPALPRRQILGIVVLAVSLSAVFAAGLWVFYGESRDYLDQSLGVRLQNIAVAGAAVVPGDSLLTWWLAETTPVAVVLLAETLAGVEADNGLSRIVVYQSDKSVLLDTGDLLRRGDPDPFLALDLAAVEQARAGIPSYSQLHQVGDTYLKAGYAPVFNSYDEVAGFVGVVGSAGFFETLGRLRRTLLVVGGTTVGLVIVLTFVYVEYARRLARVRAALQRNETLSAMGRMAAGIAHEIRNPLGIIKNTAQLLREEMQEARLDTRLVEYIPQEVDRLDQTLTGYLDFARDAPLRREPVDLCRLVRRTLRLMEPDFRQAGVRFQDNLDAMGPVELRLDAHRMQQVFLNLFLNAVQAMPDGGELTVSVEGKGGPDVRVEIRDTGVGLDPAKARHVFEPFYTSKPKGSGLGLSVVQKIVHEHGGRVRLESRPGEGARVVLDLPGPRAAI
jgi:signal transduction histidine kinase